MHSLLKQLIEYHTEEEELRKSLILRVILVGNIFLAIVAVVVNLLMNENDKFSASEFSPLILLVVLILLYRKASKKYSKVISYILIFFISLLSYYFAFGWGTSNPSSWVGLSLSVVMGGILIQAKFAMFLLLIHSLVIISLTYLQQFGRLSIIEWTINSNFGTVSMQLALLFLLGLITWLANSEVERALIKAKKYEKELEKERDLLEVKVEERTAELKKEQREKILQLYKFADFGRLATGMFHDLITPLSMVSLNLEMLDKGSKKTENKKSISRAKSGIKTMEGFVETIREQIKHQNIETKYDPCDQMSKAIDDLEHKANKSKVMVEYSSCDGCYTMGNPLRLYQVSSNLVSNAIDAYEKVRRRKNRKINVSINKQGEKIVFVVEDFGVGMTKKEIEKVFESFYTTKSMDRNLGIGLSVCKEVVENELGGTINIESSKGKGSKFTVIFPIKKK